MQAIASKKRKLLMKRLEVRDSGKQDQITLFFLNKTPKPWEPYEYWLSGFCSFRFQAVVWRQAPLLKLKFPIIEYQAGQ